MSTLKHLSPTLGLQKCDAESPASCRYGNTGHFNEAALQRIKTGSPANYLEHEAMRKDEAIRDENNRKKYQEKQKPKPTPRPQAPAPTKPDTRNNTRERRTRDEDIILYHAEIGFPPQFEGKYPTGRLPLQWSRHAQEARFDDRYGEIPEFPQFNPEQWELIEVGLEKTENGGRKYNKFLYRTELDDDNDICIVVKPPSRPGEKWLVKTVWLNQLNDLHRTLDRSKYATPGKDGN